MKLLGTKEKGHSKNSSDKQMARKKKTWLKKLQEKKRVSISKEQNPSQARWCKPVIPTSWEVKGEGIKKFKNHRFSRK